MKKPKADSPFAALKDVKLPDASAKKAPPPMQKQKAPKVTAEEEALAFHRLMSGVTKLEGKAARVPVAPPVARSLPEKTARGAEAEHEDATAHLAELAQARFEVQDDGARAEGRRVDVPPDVMRKLRRGQLPIDGRVDLHGVRAEEAKAALIEFLRKMRAQGEKCVLVIHGKGLHSARGEGVLRGEMAAWLSQSAASASVAAFCSQLDADGQAGAMMVLLRR